MATRGRAAELDDGARARLISRFGTEVNDWLEGLPALIDDVADRWGLDLIGPPRAGGTSVVLHGTSALGPVVLTLTPDTTVAEEEAHGLRAWAACRHVVRLHEADEERGVLLLEELRPGSPLSVGWEMAEVLPLLADLMTSPLPSGPTGLAPVGARVDFMFDLARRRLGPEDAPIEPLLTVGRRKARALATPSELVQPGVVHGDLHPGNVLRSDDDRRVVAIDPRPTIGDRHFDLVDWILTPEVVDEDTLGSRLDALAAAVPGVVRERARAWSAALAPLVLMPLVGQDRSTPRVRFLLDLAGG
jgi:streptomycin 6-kinase